ncbi:hypothetical protein BS78_02G140100 [Paspalum vaginatum]|nr:hypothetical protein BS78_02G140100 [Paspalum vaginatum]
MSGRQFTWANSLPNLTYEKLDRALMSLGWEFKYPLVTVQALDRGVSDHTPLLLDTGSPPFDGNSKQFKLELSWLSCDDFNNKVVEIWKRPAKGKNSVQRWNSKLSALRRYARGWAANRRGEYKKEKTDLQDKIIGLAQSRNQLASLLREEEIRYYQRAKAKDILLGGCNTRYFQTVANGKKRKKRIFFPGPRAWKN